MSDENISFSLGEINLITSLLTHAYTSWDEILKTGKYPENHSREDCQFIFDMIVETLEKFITILDEISDDEEDEKEQVPDNVIIFPIKK